MRSIETTISVGSTEVPVQVDAPEEADDRQEVAILLAHGAGGTHTSGHLPDIAAAMVDAGYPCVRFTYKLPNLAKRMEVFKAVLAHVETMEQVGSERAWVFAGHSMGGRVSCGVAEELPDRCMGVMLWSYPLHPPGKQDSLRDVPLSSLTLPIMFVRGTRDPFSDSSQWEKLIAHMASDHVAVFNVEGGDHSLKVCGKGGASKTREVVSAAISYAVDFVASAWDWWKDRRDEGQPSDAGKTDPTKKTTAAQVQTTRKAKTASKDTAAQAKTTRKAKAAGRAATTKDSGSSKSVGIKRKRK